MTRTWDQYRQIWLVDFEYTQPDGECPGPVCLVTWELKSGRKLRIWRDDFGRSPPYDVGPDSLFVAYSAAAELSCHMVLGWPTPENILDLYFEFRNLTNGMPLLTGDGLVGALTFFNLPSIGALQKDAFRELILSGGPWSAEEKVQILDYCETDVVALVGLSRVMVPKIHLGQALLRGKFAAAVAVMEHRGIPVDVCTLRLLEENWEDIRLAFIDRLPAGYHIYENGSFSSANFRRWVEEHRIPWLTYPTGALKLDQDTFRDMTKSYPEVNPIYQARLMLSHLRRVKLAVGQDGRNRASLMPFRAKTGRNTPSTTKLIFGPAVWLRSLIKPGPGYGLAYIDWSAQEFGIAARLSGDQGMMDAYTSGDPYLSFAKRIKFVPADATKESHEAARDQVKVVVLATLYGMGPQLLSSKINSSVSLSKLLLQQHRQAYPRFWEWSRAATDFASLYGCIPTVFGWVLHVAQGCKLGTLQNFPVQANGAEMLRLAVDLAVNEGAPVICPVHDAVLIESPLNMLGHDVALTRACMAQASRDVLNGFELRTDVKLIKHPERYLDKRGVEDWRLVLGVLSKSLHSKPGNVANQIPQIRECTKSNI